MREATPKVTRAAFRYQRAPLSIFVSLSGGTDAHSFGNAMVGFWLAILAETGNT